MFSLLINHIARLGEIYAETPCDSDLEYQVKWKRRELIRAMDKLKGSATIQRELEFAWRGCLK